MYDMRGNDSEMSTGWNNNNNKIIIAPHLSKWDEWGNFD